MGRIQIATGEARGKEKHKFFQPSFSVGFTHGYWNCSPSGNAKGHTRAKPPRGFQIQNSRWQDARSALECGSEAAAVTTCKAGGRDGVPGKGGSWRSRSPRRRKAPLYSRNEPRTAEAVVGATHSDRRSSSALSSACRRPVRRDEVRATYLQQGDQLTGTCRRMVSPPLVTVATARSSRPSPLKSPVVSETGPTWVATLRGG